MIGHRVPPAALCLLASVRFEGIGLHTGRRSAVTVAPGERGSGPLLVHAGSRFAVAGVGACAPGRRTVLCPEGARRVESVEHLLAAIAGLGLWDVSIEVEGDEIPAMDGSAVEFARALVAGSSLTEPGTAIDLAGPIRLEQGDCRIEAEPAGALQLDVAIEFAHPCIGSQRFVWDGSTGDFIEDLAPARTFGFVREAPELRALGLAAGAGLDCALVFDELGVMNPGGARFPDEPARHKALDLLGDLALLGGPLHARIRAHRPSHTLNLALVEAIRESTRRVIR